MTDGESPEEWLTVQILPIRQLRGYCDTTRRLSLEYDSTAKGALLSASCAASAAMLSSSMTMFEEVPGGTEATLVFEKLPPGLRAEDDEAGSRLSLEQLARPLRMTNDE